MAALRDPATYGRSDPVTMRETHASWVFLAGQWAYKVKKPVRLAFLDYSTLARRHAACREEVSINRELAGDIYRGVVAIVRREGQLRLAPEDAHGAVEYAVQMRRFDESLTLRRVLEADALAPNDLPSVARRVVTFHAAAPVVDAGGCSATLRAWCTSLDEIERLIDARSWSPDGARRFAEAFIHARAGEIDGRAVEGRVRDGHGDLRCEHVLLGDPVRIVDRVEFDPVLRQIDVGADLAFLLMDLEAIGQPRAAREVLRAYRQNGGDPGGDALVWFHAAYWALVRAKVALIRRTGDATRANARAGVESRRLRDLAERLCWRARGAVAIIVCGPPASGKSTLAAALRDQSGLSVVSSDLVRKRLAGVGAGERARPEHYTSEFTRRTYGAVGKMARERLADRTGVIIDATCGRACDREALLRRLAGARAQVLLVECRVSLQTALARAAVRTTQPGHVSDATPEVVARLFHEFSAASARPGIHVLRLDCEQDVVRQLDAVAAAADELLTARPSDSLDAGVGA